MKTTIKKAFVMILAFAVAFGTLSLVEPVTVSAAAKSVVKSLTAPGSITISKGSTKKVTAKVKATKKISAKGLSVSVKSSNKSIAAVKVVKKPGKKGKSGKSVIKITGKKVGTATITVITKSANKKNKKIKKKIRVKVRGAAPQKPSPQQPSQQKPSEEKPSDSVQQVSGITISAEKSSTYIGMSTRVTAQVVPANAKYSSLNWNVDNDSIATITKSDADPKTAIVTGKRQGTVVVTAISDNGTVSNRLAITFNKVSIESISLGDDFQMTVGGKVSLTPTFVPENPTNKNVSWTSNAPEIASVDPSTGEVTAWLEGSAVITATSEDDPAKHASVTVTVSRDSSKDVASINMYVSNSIKGNEDVSESQFPNTVLVGTNASVTIQLLNAAGNPYSEAASVVLSMDGVSGSTEYYELVDSTPSLNNSTAVATIKLKDEYGPNGGVNKKGAILSDWKKDAAYASFRLTATAGGSSISQTINVSFAQIMTETALGDEVAIDVENQHDYDLLSISPSKADGLAVCKTSNSDNYGEEYVVDQMVSSSTSNDPEDGHSVVFDAAPLLIRAATMSDESSDTYEVKDINYDISDYSVYCGEENAYKLENVPGGLEYLTLVFSKLELSKYSQIVVRAYEKGTSYPLYDDDGLIQHVITSDTKIGAGASGNTVQINKQVFNQATSSLASIDLWIFVESAGQIDNGSNKGFTLTSANGKWTNTVITPYNLVRMPSAVTWSYGGTKEYTVPTTFSEATAYLGSNYDGNSHYTISYPTFPDTGNAIIREYEDATQNQPAKYYLYPTRNVANENVLLDAQENYLIVASSEQIEPLKKADQLTTGDRVYTAKTDTYNRTVINSYKSGYVQLQAHINVQNGDKDILKYTINSSVQFSPIPKEERLKGKDYYALTGQAIELVADVRDENENAVPAVDLEWTKTDENNWPATPDGTVYDNANLIVTKTDNSGKSTISLQSNNMRDITELSVGLSSYDGAAKKFTVSLSVGGQDLKADYANLHWIKPGLWYKYDVSENAEEYDTTESTSAVTTAEHEYTVGSSWTVGTKVIAATGRECDAEVVDITNLKIDMTSISESSYISKTDIKNGVVKLITENQGKSQLNAALNGDYCESDKKCEITLEDASGKHFTVQSVGTGKYVAGGTLEIPINWVTKASYASIEIPSGNVYNIHNSYGGEGSDIMAYICVTDDYKNKISGVQVDYTITSEKTGRILEDSGTTDDKGMLPVTITCPRTEDTYTLTARKTNGAAAVEKIKFTNNSGTFGLTAGGKEISGKTVTLTFTDAVDEDILRNLLRTKKISFFDLKDKNGDSVPINGIKVDPNNAAKVIVEASETISECEINPVLKDAEGIRYVFVDKSKGILYQE